MPKVTEEDLSLLDEAALSERGYVRLPQTLEAALERLDKNETVRSWFPAEFVDVYLAHKKGELACLEGMDTAARCAAYAAVY
jgi:glutamine synthetase